MNKLVSWSAIIALGLSTTVYMKPAEAASEFTVATKNIHTRTEVLKGTAPAGPIIVLQADGAGSDYLQEVAPAKAKSDGTYELDIPEEKLIGEDHYDFYDEYDYEDDTAPNYFLEVVSVDDYAEDEDGMDEDWDEYYSLRTSCEEEWAEGVPEDEYYGEENIEEATEEGTEEELPEPEPISYDFDPIDLTVRTFVPKQATVDTKTLTRATRSVTGKVANKDVTVYAYVYDKYYEEWQQLGKAKPRSNGSYKMTINKRLYKKDASIQFVVKGNRDTDGVSKPVKRKYR